MFTVKTVKHKWVLVEHASFWRKFWGHLKTGGVGEWVRCDGPEGCLTIDSVHEKEVFTEA